MYTHNDVYLTAAHIELLYTSFSSAVSFSTPREWLISRTAAGGFFIPTTEKEERLHGALYSY